MLILAGRVNRLRSAGQKRSTYAGAVRLTEFWARMQERFGAGYFRSVAADYRLPALGATVDEALARGDEAKTVWRAVCAEFDVPRHLH